MSLMGLNIACTGAFALPTFPDGEENTIGHFETIWLSNEDDLHTVTKPRAEAILRGTPAEYLLDPKYGDAGRLLLP